MQKHPVTLIPCPTYDESAVYSAVQRGIALLGGATRPSQRSAPPKSAKLTEVKVK